MSQPTTHHSHRGWQTYEVAAILIVVLLAVWVLFTSLAGARSEDYGNARARERQDKLKKGQEQAQQELNSFGTVDGKRFRIPIDTAMQQAADAMAKDPAAFRSNLLERLPPVPAAATPAGNN